MKNEEELKQEILNMPKKEKIKLILDVLDRAIDEGDKKTLEILETKLFKSQ